MNRGKRTGVAGVEELQEVEGLASSDFSQQKAVRTMPQCGFKKVTNGHIGYAVLFPARFEPNQIGVLKMKLVR